MSRLPQVLILSLVPFCAWAQPSVVRDLEPLSPTTLSKSELEALLPGAKISRIVSSGNEHIWTNGADGTFIVSSSGRATGGMPATGRGKWHISDDGRYCVLIEWRASSDEWCRFVVKTTDGYYMTKSAKHPTEKVYKLSIAR